MAMLNNQMVNLGLSWNHRSTTLDLQPSVESVNNWVSEKRTTRSRVLFGPGSPLWDEYHRVVVDHILHITDPHL
jgi:hypothetical protein